jgi:hypothetical protein
MAVPENRSIIQKKELSAPNEEDLWQLFSGFSKSAPPVTISKSTKEGRKRTSNFLP